MGISKVTRRYWYFVTYTECPLCGMGRIYRERRYTPKPENMWELSSYQQVYDACAAL